MSTAAPTPHADTTLDTLALHLAHGIGPVLSRRLLERFGSAHTILRTSQADLERTPGIGPARAKSIREAFTRARDAAERELERCGTLGIALITRDSAQYPPLLAQAPDAPLLLYTRGDISQQSHPFPVAIVGSRACTHYGIEQAERFATALAQAGLTIVSGGARGVDTAAHRATTRIAGRTIAVLGSGLASPYPPENSGLFDEIVRCGGAVISELPLDTQPAPQNFPNRNRIIAALSLGIIVIEAPASSGALITARLAGEEYSREVMVIPGRIDSEASAGSNALIRGGATLLTCPGDAIDQLESQARHLHAGTHADRFAPADSAGRADLFEHSEPLTPPGLTSSQALLVRALASHPTIDDLTLALGVDAATIQGDLTILELRGIARREGPRFVPRKP